VRRRGSPPVAKLPQGGWLLIAWSDMNGTSRFQPNQRMQLALRPVGRLPLLRGDWRFRGRGGHEVIAFVRSCAARSSRRS
jgi:hypothetical protein